MSLLAKLPQWFKTKPLVLLRFPNGYKQALLESRRGMDHFTFAKPHGVFRDVKVPTLCLVEMPDEATCQCYVGVVKSKVAVATIDSRLTLIRLQALNLPSFNALEAKVTRRNFQTALKHKLATDYMALSLTPKLSVAIIEALSSDSENRKAIEAATFNIPKLRKIPGAEWEQLDAIKTAMAVFGLSKADLPRQVEVTDNSDSTLVYLGTHAVHALEDNVIAKDASIVPGFHLIEKNVTERAVFQKQEERLVVYTANKGPLETMLGVDLIYMNETLGNTVMVQYKMLEAYNDPATQATDWLFRPDNQLKIEMARMKLPAIAGETDDYRLYRNPFFFKFVKRKGDGESHQSIVISQDHLNQLLSSPKSKGPKGGVRVTYKALGGAYLRETDLIGLIRSGYIGTHRIESEALNSIISEVAKGNRALVLAWQLKIQMGDESQNFRDNP